MEKYNPQRVIGEFFEVLVSNLFNLKRTDKKMQGKFPDHTSQDNSFYVETKASHYSNGGVIKVNQLFRFKEELALRRFYCFCYHSLTDIAKTYKTKYDLIDALDLKSLFFFPFSIVLSHYIYSNSKPRPYRNQNFVQIIESLAQKIFDGKDLEIWKNLDLNENDYQKANPHKKLFLITRKGILEQKLLDSINSTYISTVL